MMDRRFLLALALSVIVFVIVEALFPTPPSPHGLPGADSTASVATATGAGAGGHGASATAPLSPQVSPQAARATGPSASAPPLPAGSGGATVPSTVAAETLTVTTPRTVVSFANIGGAPVSVTMRDFHSTVRKGTDTLTRPEVRLGRPGESLLRYHVIMGPDTLALDRVAFRGRATQAANGAPVVTYDADITRATGPPAGVTIQYSFGADGYLSQVTGAVSPRGGTLGGASNSAAGSPTGYLLVELPSGFTSFEADTDDDQQQLAYVVKPVHEDATSVAFGHLDPGQSELRPGPAEWAVAKDKYFLVGVLAADSVRAHQLVEVDLVGQPRTSKIATRGAATVVVPLTSTADGGASFAFQLYTGPQEFRRLRAIGHEPVRRVLAPDSAAVRDAGRAVDPLAAQDTADQLRVGARHFRHRDPGAVVARESACVADQLEDAAVAARADGSTDPVQERPAAPAGRNGPRVPRARDESVESDRGMSADDAPAADLRGPVFRVPEHHRVSRGAVPLAARHLGPGPLLHHADPDGGDVVPRVMGRHA